MEAKTVFQTGWLGLSLLVAACHPKPANNTVSGTIETDEVHVASRYGGRVEALLALEGDPLRGGQVLARLAAAELVPRRDRLAAQLAELTAGPRPQEIAAARADWEAQVALLDFARADAQRATELFAQKTISVTERDQAISRSNATEKSAAALKCRYDLLLAGTRSEELVQVRAQLAELDTQLQEMSVAAPSDSVLEVLSVKVGDVLAPNQPIATLLLTNHLWVRVFVPETWLGRMKLGEAARVRVDAFPDREFTGVIEQIARAAEFTPRNVQTVEERIKQVFGVKVRLDPAGQSLRPGMSADLVFAHPPP